MAAVWLLHQVRRLYVSPQFGGQGVAFSTDSAAMGPFSSVQSLVGLQAVRVPQRFSTVATEETSPSVGKHVPAKFWFLRESLVALGAGIRLLSIVNSQMALEVSFLTEALPTVLTDVRLFPCVEFHVVPQRTGVCQQLRANCTLHLRGLHVDHSAAVKEAVDA